MSRSPPGLFKAARAPRVSYPSRLSHQPSCATAGTLASRRRHCFLASAAVPSLRSRPRSAPGGEQPSCVVRCRPRAPRRPRNLAGLRRRTEPRRRVERRRRGVSAVRTAPVDFPVVRAISWCYLCTKPSPSARARVARRRSPPHAAVPATRRRSVACTRSPPPDLDPAI
jgi:hypothetical protein